MDATPAPEPLRLAEDDLLDVLRPRYLIVGGLISAVFALLSMHGSGDGAYARLLLVAVVGVGAILAVFSPQKAFVLCVFLFAFRNQAYSLGPFKIADPLFAITAVSWCIHAVLQGKLRLHGSLVPVTVYVAVVLLSGLGCYFPGAYAAEGIRLIYIVGVYFVAVQIMGRRRTFLLSVKAFLAAGYVMAVCSVIGFLFAYVLHRGGAPFIDPEGRTGVMSIAVDPLRVSSFMIFPMMLMCGLQRTAPRWRQRATSSALFWLGMVSCAVSLSRSALLQVFPALLVNWLYTRRQLSRLVLVLAGTGAILAFIAFATLDSQVVQQYGLQRWALAGKLASQHTEPREIVWAASMNAVKQYPILGVGLGQFLPRYMEFRDRWITTGYLDTQNRVNHSTYMTALTENGILGLFVCLVMLACFWWLGRRALRAARADGDPARYMVGVATLASYAGQLGGGIALDLLSHNHVWVIMALLAVLDVPVRRPQAVDERAPAEQPA